MIFLVALVVIGALFALWPDAIARVARGLYPLTQNPEPSPEVRRSWYLRAFGVVLAASAIALLIAAR